jgi:arginyl-tRNA synthetase
LNLKRLLSERVAAALARAGAADAEPQLGPATRPEFGDYQANGVMGAAKALKRPPRPLAESVIGHLDLAGIAASVDIAGPGFINIRLAPDFLASLVAPAAPMLAPAPTPETVVIDYSSPNLAKEMHVGHLRSTIIGDAMARVLEALGHRVIRQNHVGDWGTQFGMLLAYLEESGERSELLSDLERFYQAAKKKFDDDPDFADRARARVVTLQSGDPESLRLWQRFIAISLGHCQAIYDRLGVTLRAGDVHAESAYNDALPGVIAALDQQGLLTVSEGARCVFLPEFVGKDAAPLPLIVQKSDGGYLYSTTDLAAVAHRCGRLGADRLMYFVDARQSLHFRQMFAVARAAGFASDDCRLEHHAFGTILGKDGRPFRSRDGGLVKLAELLDEAVERAFRLVTEKDPALPDAERRAIARTVGIGAVKYADLSKNRTTDYVFDWDTMLSFEGNTAPYLQYAVTRIRSLFRRGGIDPAALTGAPVLVDPAERALALELARLQEVVDDVAEQALPHLLCGYLMELAGYYMRFYEQCPVLAADAATRTSRLLLCARVAATLEQGLALLGIGTVERM